MSSAVQERLAKVLSQGKRGEIGRASEIALEALDNPAMVGDLLSCLTHSDPAVVAHAAHAVMQVGASDVAPFDAHTDRLIDLLDNCSAWEIGEQLPKILAELDLSQSQLQRIEPILIAQIDNRSAIASASALSALARLAARSMIDGAKVDRLISTAAASPRKAVAARARRLMAG